MADELLPGELATMDHEVSLDADMMPASVPPVDSLFELGRCNAEGFKSFWRPRLLVNSDTIRQGWWLRNWKAVAVVRAVFFVWLLVMLIIAVTAERSMGFLRTYSYCTYLLELVTCLLMFLATLLNRPRLTSLATIMLQCSVAQALTVTVAFWTLIAKPEHWSWSQYRAMFIHGFNFLVLFLECCALNRIVFVPLQGCVAILVFDLLYFCCVLLPVQLVTGKPIYVGLTDFARLGVFVAVAVGIFICNILVFFIFLLISFGKAKCVGRCGVHQPLPLRLFARRGESRSDDIALT